jgi:transposase
MTEVAVIGLDLAKHVFQVHGADAAGVPVLRKVLRRHDVLAFFGRLPRCLVGMEACATAHHWAREISALGHEVRLIPPRYVRPFVKRNKNDAADAEAIAEAVVRPTMHFAPVKSADQQSVLMLHRARDLLVRQRTMLVNAFRGHCAEFGLIAAQGVARAKALIATVRDPESKLPQIARAALLALVAQLDAAEAQIETIEDQLNAWCRSNEAAKRLVTIPGVGLITATALVATVVDARQFRSGRHMAAWMGLVPRQYSSGGKEKLGGISKRGDGYLRRLLVHGARAAIRWQRSGAVPSAWLDGLLARRPKNVALVAMANKTTRVAWAVLTRGTRFQAANT